MKFLKKVSEILKDPHPLVFSIVKYILSSITLGAFVFGFLSIFKPFGLQVLSDKELITLTSGYGLVTTGYLIIHSLIIGSFLNEKNWTVWKEIINTLIIIAMIGVCNFIYHAIYFKQTIILIKLIGFQLETLAVSLLPISVIIIIKQNFLLKKYLQEAAEINRQKSGNLPEERHEKSVTISALNPKNNIIFNCNELLFIHAQDNYVIVHFIKESKYKKEIIRTTLKKTKDDLYEYPNFYHCHKSFIVNLDKVINVSGNAQGLKLHFDYTNDIIPVSRQLHREFMDIYSIN